MEIIFYLTVACLILVVILGFYDGFYLHLWKYQLYKHKESLYEHKVHTIRAVLFPLIIWFLFIESDIIYFYSGLTLVVLDLIILGVDAYSEKDSRKFMNGLPQQEYLLHLIVNGLHFAAIFLFLSLKIELKESSFYIVENLNIINLQGNEVLNFVSIQIIPGSILFAIIHILLLFPKVKSILNKKLK